MQSSIFNHLQYLYCLAGSSKMNEYKNFQRRFLQFRDNQKTATKETERIYFSSVLIFPTHMKVSFATWKK